MKDPQTDHLMAWDETFDFAERAQRLLTEIAINANKLAEHEIDRAVDHALQAIAELTSLRWVHLGTFSKDKKRLQIAHQAYRKSASGHMHWMDSTPLAALPWVKQQLEFAAPTLLTNIAQLPPDAARDRERFERDGLQALAFAPVQIEDQLAGIFCIASAAPMPQWTAEFGNFVGQTARLLGNILSRKRQIDVVPYSFAGSNDIFEHSEVGLLSIVESLSEGLIMADENGIVTYVNPRFGEITGYSKEETLGRRVYEIFYSNAPRAEFEMHRDGFHKRYRERMQGIQEQYDLKFTRNDGQIRWLEVKAAPLRNSEGKIIGSIGMNIDVTERKELEAQLRWSQKMEAVGRLAGGVAHDFNNLLTVILGYANLLLKRSIPGEKDHRQVDAIRSAAETACLLTQQLLTVSRKQVVQPVTLDLNATIRSTTDVISGLLGPRIQLATHLHDDIPLIQIDPGQLQQVVMNLVVNARDSMPNGGVVSIKTQRCVFSTASTDARVFPRLKPGEYAVLSISDTGAGMDETVKTHLFEPFFTRKRGGTGLGLSTVYGIVEQHSGHISVSSEIGFGSTLTIYFPRSEGALESAEEDIRLQSVHGNETVLLVEDEDPVRELVREVLEKNGYNILEAAHGGEALDIIAERKGSIELLLTDVVMPYVSGFELVERVSKEHPDMKILMMSGYTADPMIPENISKKGIPFLAKPFSPDLLAEKVRQVLSQAPSEVSAVA